MTRSAVINLTLATLGPATVVTAFVIACATLVGCAAPAPRVAQAPRISSLDLSYQLYLRADCRIWAPVMRLPYCQEN
jgi:hypothetical protein